ncbi:dGTPase family protein, partial [Vibrio parahaemolyticus V-223/04]
MSRARYR